MKRLIALACHRQKGFTILEVLIAVAIVGVMGSGAATVLRQTFAQSGRSTAGMQTIEQVENTAYWINHDALMAQTITLGAGSGFPLTLNWQDTTGNMNQVTYAVQASTTNLQRTLKINGVTSTVISVASRISTDPAKTNCSYSGGVLTFQISSTIGTALQTRNYQAKVRIDQPSTYLTIITQSQLPTGYNGSQYNGMGVGLSATGGTTPYTWTLSSGSSLPTGLSLSSSGTISGTPSVGSTVCTYTFTVQVKDYNNLTATQEFTIPMNLLTITTSSLPGGKKGKGYGVSGGTPTSPVHVTAIGGTGSGTYTWTVTTDNPPYNRLPPPLTLNSSSGLISGTPDSTTGGNTYTFNVQVTDTDGNSANQILSIAVSN